jgi:hypothetical protein
VTSQDFVRHDNILKPSLGRILLRFANEFHGAQGQSKRRYSASLPLAAQVFRLRYSQKSQSSRRSPFDFVSGGIGNFGLALRSGLSGEKQSNSNQKDACRSGEPRPLPKNCIPCEAIKHHLLSLPRRTGLPLHPTTRSQNQSSFRLIVRRAAAAAPVSTHRPSQPAAAFQRPTSCATDLQLIRPKSFQTRLIPAAMSGPTAFACAPLPAP